MFARLFLMGVCTVLLASHAIAQERTVGVIHSDPRVSEGYLLFCPLRTTTTYLIDTEGRIVHSWTDHDVPGQMAYLHENGYLYRLGITDTPSKFTGGGGGAGVIECRTWDNDIVWSFEHRSDEECLHHDICPMPNGNVLFIAWEDIPHDIAVAAGKDTTGFRTDLWPEKIIEIEPDGNGGAQIVWEWRTWDRVIQDRDPQAPNFGVIADHPERLDINAPIRVGGVVQPADWLHANGVKYNEALDQVVISFRHLDEIWIIDHSTTTEEAAGRTGGRYGKGGDILYRYGNPQVYGRGTDEARKLYGQHDPQWIPAGYPGEGNLLLFNNGEFDPAYQRIYSTVDEIEPPQQSVGVYLIEDGEPFGPTAPVWSFQAKPPRSLFGRYVSGTNRMPGGNTIICAGTVGEFWEVTPEGDVVWKYVNPVTRSGILTQGDTANDNLVFKMRKYPGDHPAFFGHDLTPGETIESYPTDIEPLSSPGSIQLLADVYPNPTQGAVHIRYTGRQSRIRLSIYDATGREVATLAEGLANPSTFTWNGLDKEGERVPAGMYHVVLISEGGIESQHFVKW